MNHTWIFKESQFQNQIPINIKIHITFHNINLTVNITTIILNSNQKYTVIKISMKNVKMNIDVPHDDGDDYDAGDGGAGGGGGGRGGGGFVVCCVWPREVFEFLNEFRRTFEVLGSRILSRSNAVHSAKHQLKNPAMGAW